MLLIDPLISFDAISLDEANAALVAWEHKMGPFNRPNFGNRVRCHGLRHNGDLIGCAITDRAIASEVAGLPRDGIVELARVCAARRDLNRVIVRLWREFVLPAICREWGATTAISYQDAVLHSGDLYRFDGWTAIGKSSSGTDKRSNRKGRSKIIWAWPAPAAGGKGPFEGGASG